MDNSRSRLGGSVDGDSSLTCRTAAILSAVAAESNMIRLACPKCHRSGQYRVDRLLEKYGPDIATPDPAAGEAAAEEAGATPGGDVGQDAGQDSEESR